MVGFIILFLMAGMGMGIMLVPFLALVALARSIQMISWGVMALKPVSERKPYLAAAQPRRLIGAGGGLLAGTAIMFGVAVFDMAYDPHFGGLIRKSNEGASKGNLGAIRSALSIYYGDMEGVYPPSLEALTIGGKYLPSIPKAKTPGYHHDSGEVHRGKVSDDKGGWLYNDDPKDGNFGRVLVNCLHTDTKGSVWTLY